MKIAIPLENGRLHPHFGGCRQFALVDLDPDSKRATHTEVVDAPEHQPGLFPWWLGEHGVHTVIAGGIGHRALERFARRGISVRAGTAGATLEALVADFAEGRLTSPPSGCDHHHPDHDHDHEPGHHHRHHHPHPPGHEPCPDGTVPTPE